MLPWEVASVALLLSLTLPALLVGSTTVVDVASLVPVELLLLLSLPLPSVGVRPQASASRVVSDRA